MAGLRHPQRGEAVICWDTASGIIIKLILIKRFHNDAARVHSNGTTCHSYITHSNIKGYLLFIRSGVTCMLLMVASVRWFHK